MICFFIPFILICVCFVKLIDIIFNRVKVCWRFLGGRMHKSRGFTLIELMVTIAVMAVVASIAAPSFSDMLKSYKLNQSTEQMMQALKEGRSRAAAARAMVVICPNKNSTGQEITVDQCLTSVNVTGTAAAAYKDTNRIILANMGDGVKVSDDLYVVFSATGVSLDSASNAAPKAKKIVICSDQKTREIGVTVLGGVSLNSKGTCA